VVAGLPQGVSWSQGPGGRVGHAEHKRSAAYAMQGQSLRGRSSYWRGSGKLLACRRHTWTGLTDRLPAVAPAATYCCIPAGKAKAETERLAVPCAQLLACERHTLTALTDRLPAVALSAAAPATYCCTPAGKAKAEAERLAALRAQLLAQAAEKGRALPGVLRVRFVLEVVFVCIVCANNQRLRKGVS
jgi:hypothetical protein